VQGAVFQPDEITVMKSALDGTATMLPQAKRTPSMKVEMASRILTGSEIDAQCSSQALS
jgi:hypothetical protein